jgi:hypothetical protein
MTHFLKFMEKIYVWLLILLLCIIGISGSNIIHFGIEDYFQTALIRSYFFGVEYALSQSVFLVCSLCYFFLIVFQNYLKKRIDIFNVSYKKLFLFFAFCFAVNIFVYITIIVYSYFSGRSEAGGLYRILVTILFSLLALFFIYNRVSEKENVLTRFSRLIETSLLLLLSCVTFYITMTYASPKEHIHLQNDIKLHDMIKNFSLAVENFYVKNNHLPKEKTVLDSAGYLKSYAIDLDKITYKTKDSNTFSICGDFLTNSKDFRRINQMQNGSITPFKKGHFCFNYQLKSDTNPKNGKGYTQRILVSTNVYIK